MGYRSFNQSLKLKNRSFYLLWEPVLWLPGRPKYLGWHFRQETKAGVQVSGPSRSAKAKNIPSPAPTFLPPFALYRPQSTGPELKGHPLPTPPATPHPRRWNSKARRASREEAMGPQFLSREMWRYPLFSELEGKRGGKQTLAAGNK